MENPSRVYFIVSRDDLYKFQVSNADIDGFIKLLLRSYTGLFTGFVHIDEHLLAKRMGIDQEQVYNFLKHLRNIGIIDYVPQNNTPYIFFCKERLAPDRLKISKEGYQQRKDEFQQRIESVIEYATCTTKCRRRMLLAYFGETVSLSCGTCDVCKSVHSMGLTNFEFENISTEIKSILHEPCTYEKLLMELKGDQQKIRMVVKWLLDNERIIYRIDSLLEWVEE